MLEPPLSCRDISCTVVNRGRLGCSIIGISACGGGIRNAFGPGDAPPARSACLEGAALPTGPFWGMLFWALLLRASLLRASLPGALEALGAPPLCAVSLRPKPNGATVLSTRAAWYFGARSR